MLQGLKRVTGGFKKGYIGLQSITKATIVKRGFKQLQRVTRDYRVTKAYKG